MRIPPFEPARRDESNGGIPILPRPLDAELIDKISLNQCFSTAPFDVSSNISTSSGHRRMGIPPFEPAYRPESNGSTFISPRPLDTEIFYKTLNSAVPQVIKTHHSLNSTKPIRTQS